VRPAEDAPADVYIYRDTSDAPDSAATGAAGEQTGERDASYWYNLSGAESAPVLVETRGPFEPLVSSSGGPPPATPEPAPDTSAALVPPNVGGDTSPEDSAPGRSGKLEQIREFYLTAEAIGDKNVDKHFDQLLAQQRDLISEYFKQSPAAAQAGADQPPGPRAPGAPAPGGAGDAAAPGQPGSADGRAGTPRGPSVVAEPPRVW